MSNYEQVSISLISCVVARRMRAKGTYDILVFLRVMSNFRDGDGATGLLTLLVLTCRQSQLAQGE